MSHSVQITSIHLRVSTLSRSLDFYSRQLGFAILRESEREAHLGPAPGGPVMLTLTESPGAPPSRPDAAGLFHCAVLFPSRARLGAWLRFTAEKGVDFEGFSDHAVSEAIYLSDPDGNGLEFYADRPREVWPFVDGELAMTTRPLDVHGLLADSAPADSEPLSGAKWGHLHLRVTDLDRSEAFYRSQLGLEVMQRSFPGARFMAAEGYHHHLGLNTWGAPNLPQPPNALGLATAVFARNGTTEEMLVDPDGIHLRVQPSLVPA